MRIQRQQGVTRCVHLQALSLRETHPPGIFTVREGVPGKGLGIVAIASNDTTEFPEDGPEGMKEEAAEAGYTFPYLFDEKQQVAQTFRAACTPDLFLFDGSRRLEYRGQFDGSRPKNDVPVNGADLRAAADAVLAGKPAPAVQKPSIGCNIKWSPGNAPEYLRKPHSGP